MDEIYCSAPWKGVTIKEDGLVRTCCVGSVILGDLKHEKIEDIMSSDKLSSIKKNLLKNVIDKNCDYCEKSETLGNTSLRQHYLKHYPLLSSSDNFELQTIDVRWNNHCNLSCVYCNPKYSTTWAKIKNIPILSSKKPYQDALLDWILSQSSKLCEVTIVGGEPLLMKQNYQLIENLPDQCQLSIITNLSYDLSKISCLDSLLSRPRKLTNWNISVENIGSQFEYIRRGANWEQFLKNIDFILKEWPENVTLLMVYGIFSALTLDKTIKFFHDRGVKKFVLQSLFNNEELSVMKMPESLKDSCLKSLERTKIWHQKTFGSDVNLYPIDGLDHLIKQLKNYIEPTIEWVKLKEKIDEFDRYNNEGIKFIDLWPDILQAFQISTTD